MSSSWLDVIKELEEKAFAFQQYLMVSKQKIYDQISPLDTPAHYKDDSVLDWLRHPFCSSFNTGL